MTLLEAGADPTILCNDHGDEFGGIHSRPIWYNPQPDDHTRGLTALHAYCTQGYRASSWREQDSQQVQDAFSMLIERGASVHQRTGDGRTALHAAVNNPILVRLLLNAGADPNAVDDNGCAPIHSVTCADSVDVLLQEGHTEIDRIRTTDGNSPLLCVLSQHNKDAILKLLSYGPNLSIKDNKGNGPLHIAVSQYSADTTVLKTLLIAGVDPNERNHAGQTPLLAMRMNNRECFPIMDLLLEYGADINAKSPGGTILLFQALGNSLGVKSDHSDIKDLLKRGADPKSRDYNGKTLLHHAVATHSCTSFDMGHKRDGMTRLDFAVSLCLDKHAVDHDGNTLFHEAALRSGILDSYYASAQVALLNRILELGIDIDQANYQGRTALHILAATMSSSRGSYNAKSGFQDTLDWMINKTDNIDQGDHQGLTALHLASTVSEYSVKRLLDGGANPTLASHDGITSLHFAARTRHPNIVGLLLQYLDAGNLTVIDCMDMKGRTPLHYACRSGLIETVKLLLDAGADASDKNLLFACAEFQDEQMLWTQDVHPAYVKANQQARGITIDDKTRMCSSSIHKRSNELDAPDDVARLDEIIETLIAHGCDTSPLFLKVSHAWGSSALEKAADLDFQYTLSCLMRARDKVPRDVNGFSTNTTLLEENAVKYQERAISNFLTDYKHLQPGEANGWLVIRLLKKRQYFAIKSLFDRGISFLKPWSEHNTRYTLELFAEHGYVSLLETFGELEVERSFGEGKWHAVNDKTKPGLHRELVMESMQESYSSSVGTILLTALRRELPNMDIVRLLVDKFHVDINQFSWSPGYSSSGKYEWGPTESPLHYLASGTYWWHAALALPYLISRGADLNVRNQSGSTPLHIAIGGAHQYVGVFHKQAAKALIFAGADGNARDGSGKTCLATAVQDVELVHLLLDHGVVIDADAVFAATEMAQVDVLRAFLDAGADPNMRREMKSLSQDSHKKRATQRLISRPDPTVPTHEKYPLYTAATSHGVSGHTLKITEQHVIWQKSSKIVEALLSAGADPFATFKKRRPTSEEETHENNKDEFDYRGPFSEAKIPTEKFEDVMVLHELLAAGKLIHPVIQLQTLNGAKCDPHGRTLLHAACHSHAPTAPIDALYYSAEKTYKSSLPSFLDCLLARGVDPVAKDHSSRNVLHHMFINTERPHNADQNLASLKLLLVQYPALRDESDIFGNTPLLMAIKFAVMRGDVAPAYALLEAGADPFVVDRNGNGCLYFLSYRVYESSSLRSLFSTLLTRGLDINLKNKRGETPIFNLNRHLPCLTNSADPKTVSNVLAAAAALSFFIKAGADLLAKDSQGRGLLHIAAREALEPSNKNMGFALSSAQFDVTHKPRKAEPWIARFQVLLQKGLDPMMEDRQKRTALDVAAAFGKASVLGLFEKDSINIGCSPLNSDDSFDSDSDL